MVDGDGCLSAVAKSSMKLGVSSKYKSLPDVLKLMFKGIVYKHSNGAKWTWEVSFRQGAKDILAAIHPYLRNKRQQASMLLDMEPGQAQEVMGQLRQLKGKGVSCKPFTPKLYKLPPKLEPVGVHKRPNGRFLALIRVHGVEYSIGTFDEQQDASAAYVRYRDIYEEEKRTGRATFDWESLRAPAIKAARVAKGPPPERKRNIYYIAATGCYQVKLENPKYCKTFKTEEEAVAMRDSVLHAHAEALGTEYVDVDTVEQTRTERFAKGPPAAKKKNVFFLKETATYQVRMTKRGHTLCKVYQTEEEAVAARDAFLAEHGLAPRA